MPLLYSLVRNKDSSNMKFALAIAVVAAVAVQGYCFNPISAPLRATQKMISGSLGLANGAVQLKAALGSQGLQQGADITKQGIAANQQLGSTMIQGSANLTDKAIGVANEASAPLPIVGGFVNGVNQMVSSGVKVGNDAAQAALGGLTNYANSAVDTANSVGQDMISNAASTSNSFFGKMTDASDKIFNSVIDRIPNFGDATPSTTPAAAQTETTPAATTAASQTESTPAATAAAAQTESTPAPQQ